IPTTIELTVLLTADECFGRLPLEEFARIPVLPPPNLSLESREVCLVNNDQVQIARLRLRTASHCRPYCLLRGNAEADLATPAQIQVSGMDTRPLGHCFQKIAVASVLSECPGGSAHQISIHELQWTRLREVVQCFRCTDH